MINKYLMNSRMLLVAVLLTAVTSIKLTHQQTYNLACCPKGMTYDRREYICVCPPGTEPSGPNKICCPPGTIGTLSAPAIAQHQNITTLQKNNASSV